MVNHAKTNSNMINGAIDYAVLRNLKSFDEYCFILLLLNHLNFHSSSSVKILLIQNYLSRCVSFVIRESNIWKRIVLLHCRAVNIIHFTNFTNISKAWCKHLVDRLTTMHIVAYSKSTSKPRDGWTQQRSWTNWFLNLKTLGVITELLRSRSPIRWKYIMAEPTKCKLSFKHWWLKIWNYYFTEVQCY